MKYPPPNNDEFELTVFGPGIGESIVLHIPGIGWALIDSCEFGPFKQRFVPPLEYLISQNVQKLEFLSSTLTKTDPFVLTIIDPLGAHLFGS